MGEICFRYTSADAAVAAMTDLARLAPAHPRPHLGAQDREVVHVPEALWERPLAPELAIGLGGRLVECEVIEDEATCSALRHVEDGHEAVVQRDGQREEATR